MQKLVAALFFAFLAGAASAQSCPDYYRFVEFGLEDRDGVLRRGGPLFRAVSLANRDQLLGERTVCREVEPLASDGHGHPIPVVAFAAYDPAKIEIGVTALALSVLTDDAAAERAAAPHLDALAQGGPTLRGETYLCAAGDADGDLSCQVVSPYAGLPAPVVYCTATECEMPFLQLNEKVSAQAAWSRHGDSAEATTAGILEMVQRLHDFWVEPS